jgi:hypothetical protein
MTDSPLTPSERANFQVFRGVAAEMRAAAATARSDQEGLRMVRGYVETEGDEQRIRNLCIPVRRTYLKKDPINFLRILNLASGKGPPEIKERAAALEVRYTPLVQELESTSILNDRKVTHAEMFEAWTDAIVFYDVAEKRNHYAAMVDEMGKAVEGIALHLAERMAELVLELDDLVADLLGEPRGQIGPSGAER